MSYAAFAGAMHHKCELSPHYLLPTAFFFTNHILPLLHLIFSSSRNTAESLLPTFLFAITCGSRTLRPSIKTTLRDTTEKLFPYFCRWLKFLRAILRLSDSKKAAVSISETDFIFPQMAMTCVQTQTCGTLQLDTMAHKSYRTKAPARYIVISICVLFCFSVQESCGPKQCFSFLNGFNNSPRPPRHPARYPFNPGVMNPGFHRISFSSVALSRGSDHVTCSLVTDHNNNIIH
jgi:hypothetical protein